MNRYEAIYKKNSNRLPYYKPYLGLLNDHRTLDGLLANPKRIIATPCFRQYRDEDGTIRSVEEWIMEMILYEFEPLEFIDEYTKGNRTSLFSNEYDNCIPAFNEIQAKALYLAHIATNSTDTILAEPIYDHFRKFLGKPVVKPTIGDARRPAEPADILRAGRILYLAGFLALGLGLAARLALPALLRCI